MKPYPKYKPTNIDWIGEIPESWGISRVKWELNFHNNKRIPIEADIRGNRQGQFPYYGASGIIDYVDDYIFDGEYILVGEDGANILSRSSPLAFLAKGKFWVNNHAHILKAKNNQDNYFSLQIELNDFTTKASGSAQPKLTKEAIGDLELIVPPLPEQQAIVSYLDQKTALIDELIAKKERKIELLKENRTALINHAVTKGLDPTVKYKDSGIEWIGEIPEHWEVSSFKYFIKLRHGHQFRDGDFTDSGIKIIKITQLDKEGYLNIENCSTIDENRLNEFSDILIKDNDILMCLTGGTIGKIIKVGKVNEPLLQNYRVGHFSSFNKILIENDFIFYLMSSHVILGQIFYDVRETGQPNIGLEDMNRMKICVPPILEQKQIVIFLDENIKIIDQNINLELQKIEKLKEYRQSLISNVVTGKICVLGDSFDVRKL